MPSVFPINVNPPVHHTLGYVNYIAEMGDGFEQRVNKNLAYSHATGEGTVVSYKGINRFKIEARCLAHINSDSAQEANKFWAFYKARLGSYEPFYFYNPAEAVIDLTGAATTGRYLVRFEQADLTRNQFILKLFNYGISLVEVRA